MSIPPLQTLGDYCRRTNLRQICLGFQLANSVTFDIKNHVLTNLKEYPFDGKTIRDPWKHLAKLYETCSICKPAGEIIDDRVNYVCLIFP